MKKKGKIPGFLGSRAHRLLTAAREGLMMSISHRDVIDDQTATWPWAVAQAAQPGQHRDERRTLQQLAATLMSLDSTAARTNSSSRSWDLELVKEWTHSRRGR